MKLFKIYLIIKQFHFYHKYLRLKIFIITLFISIISFKRLPDTFIIFDTEFTAWEGSMERIGQVKMSIEN